MNAKPLSEEEIKGLCQSLQSDSWASAWLSEDIRECVISLLETLVIAEAGRRQWEHLYRTDQSRKTDEEWQDEVRKEWGME